jgi:hypothetical protein
MDNANDSITESPRLILPPIHSCTLHAFSAFRPRDYRIQ